MTSSISAPRIVAHMLGLLELSPGMHVLEIGAGSGYNAALLAELVGPEGSVVSVDIDPELVAAAAGRLSGYRNVELVAADGYFGWSAGAPFDRVVATVGCRDVAPAWVEQLAPAGRCLLPLDHGGWHPLTRVERAGEQICARAISPAGFVSIRGRQAAAERPTTVAAYERSMHGWAALPERLATALRPPAGQEAFGGRRLWDLAYLLSLQGRATGWMGSLVDGESVAMLDPLEGRVGWRGPRGADLRDQLLGDASLWLDLRQPRMEDYHSTFEPLTEVAADGTWVVERVDFRQVVRLGNGRPT